jgi:hypothetical protein
LASVGFTPAGPRPTANYLASVGFTPAGPRLIATQGGAIPPLFFLLPPKAEERFAAQGKPDGRLLASVGQALGEIRRNKPLGSLAKRVLAGQNRSFDVRLGQDRGVSECDFHG